MSVKLQKKIEIIEALELKARLRKELPHIYAYDGKMYCWANDVISSTAKKNFLCGGNQISKSSTLIRLIILNCTEPDRWQKLWGGTKPLISAFYGPDKSTITSEFKDKWVNEWLPRGEAKESGKYSWKESYKDGEIDYLEFLEAGTKVYFRSYSQKPSSLQAKTLYATYCDEECPESHFSEIIARLTATDGIYYNFFTATLGQDYLAEILEPHSPEDNPYPEALRKTVSLYDCVTYSCGSPSKWTLEKVREKEQAYSRESERQKRIYGRFVLDSGLVFETFSTVKNVQNCHPLPSNWLSYIGIDIGSGGKNNHPAAIVVVTANPSFNCGKVSFSWRGDGIVTTAGDILDKLFEVVSSEVKTEIAEIRYDWASKDFGLLFQRDQRLNYLHAIPADKSRSAGLDLLNTLFRLHILKIMLGESAGDNSKLVTELSTNLLKTKKNNAKDDLSDALRYAAINIPWNLNSPYIDSGIDSGSYKPVSKLVKYGRGEYYQDEIDGLNLSGFDAEIDEFNRMLDDY